MNVGGDYKLAINISKYNYSSKEESNYSLSNKTSKFYNVGRMCFSTNEISIDEFIDLATDGYAFCNLFNLEDRKYLIKTSSRFGYKSLVYPFYKRGVNKGYMKLNFKRQEFYKGQQCIFVDIDETEYNSIDEYVSTLPNKPTFCYNTFSNKVNKAGSTSIRFRMVYCFDRILNKIEFKSIANSLKNEIELATGEPMYDICWTNECQYFNGGNDKNGVYVSYLVYEADKWLEGIEIWEDKNEALKSKKNESIVSRKMINDLKHLSLNQFLYKYRYTEYIENNKANYDVDYRYWNYTDDDYIQLYYNVNTITDGHKRRKKLFYRGLQRRKINPLASADVICVNYVRDLYKFIDNSDGVIDIDTIIESVNRIMRTNTGIIDSIKSDSNNRPQYVINSKFPINVKRKMAAMARGDVTIEKVGELYDTSISLMENLKIMNEIGMKISRTTLYNATKKLRINTRLYKSHFNKKKSYK